MFKKITIIISFIIFFVYSIVLTYCYFSQKLQVLYAEEQVKIFFLLKREIYLSEQNRDIALKLASLVNYYPSGTKQEQNSKLDILVENVRKSVIEDVIIFLINKTGKDFGTKPQIWIENLAEPGRTHKSGQ